MGSLGLSVLSQWAEEKDKPETRAIPYKRCPKDQINIRILHSGSKAQVLGGSPWFAIGSLDSCGCLGSDTQRPSLRIFAAGPRLGH